MFVLLILFEFVVGCKILLFDFKGILFYFVFLIVIWLLVMVGSFGFRVEVNIFKYVRKEWLELRDRFLFFFDDNCVMFFLLFDC